MTIEEMLVKFLYCLGVLAVLWALGTYIFHEAVWRQYKIGACARGIRNPNIAKLTRGEAVRACNVMRRYGVPEREIRYKMGRSYIAPASGAKSMRYGVR